MNFINYRQAILDIAKAISSYLTNQGILVLRYDAMTSNSIYLKLDYGVCNSVRISDHPSNRRHLNYKYNLNLADEKASVPYHIMNKYPMYFYNQDSLMEMFNFILEEKNAKLIKYQKSGYERLMRKNRQEHLNDKKGFWNNAKLVQ